ncbi:carbohydrate kinase family protein [Cellulomonas sp. URHD0024]|uniref:carbohydrate kinase family protein n=1 Tax=Cellulomonas sp. URHD0024 TaxID=1302620 RepID=UPI0004027472|nr:carbohydrate kinase family protein [Cellulomonas sp. URHD0024]
MSARTVLVAGDANVDLVLRGDVVPRFGQAEQLADSGDLALGGSASIAACGLARLGVPTSLVARVGDDALGRFQLDALRAAGVETSGVEVDPITPTGLSVILSTADDRAILTVPGTIPTLRAGAVRTALTATGARHLHLASYFLQPALADDLPALLAEVRAAGVTVSLDTNWDPAQKWEGVLDLLPLVDVLLPNLAELRAIGAVAGAAGPDLVVARRLAALGPRIVVKAGADGGWSVGSDDAPVHAHGLVVEVVDTTGAGDSFDAGYLAALAHGVDDEGERLRWAATAGSLSTLGSGGTGRQATLEDLRPR